MAHKILIVDDEAMVFFGVKKATQLYYTRRNFILAQHCAGILFKYGRCS